MDVFLILQILFDAVLFFGILFLFHFLVNLQQKKKEDFDIIKNVQVQEMKENLETLLSTMKELGKNVSDDIQKKMNESDEKTEILNQNFKKLEGQLNTALRLAEELKIEKKGLENKMGFMRPVADKEKLPSDKTAVGRIIYSGEKKKKPLTRQTGYATGFSSGIVKQVYKMIDGKMDISEVAKATKLTKAEINLILNLRENRFTAPN